MIILTLRTDRPDAEISLYMNTKQIDHEVWQAHRTLSQTLHSKIEAILGCHQKTVHDVQGIVCFKGPGSFTGLRIGLSVANALSYSLQVPIIATMGDTWETTGIAAILQDKYGRIVLPEYGVPPHTTEQKH